MILRPLVLLLGVGLLVLPSVGAAQDARLSSLAPPARFSDPDRLAKISRAFSQVDQLVRGFGERSRVPGLAYGIIVDGRLVHVGTAGFRDLATSSPVDTASVFRIASMTKSFTALSILQLRDAGLLSLDDPAAKYVPELASLRYPTADSPEITIRHLLTHSTGFPEDNPWGDQQLAATEAEMSRMITGGIPFSTPPGSGYEYSNFGYAILGRIIANVSGLPYPEYVQRRVLEPLEMTVTTLEAAEVAPTRLAHGYRLQDGNWLEEKQLPDGSFGPMGGMLTSISDLAKWVGFMLDAWPAHDGAEEGPLRRASAREMQNIVRFSGATAERDPATGGTVLRAGGYGYGLRVQQTCDYRSQVSHTGGLPGFGSIMTWLPDYGVGVVGLGNLTYTSWTGIANQAVALLAETGGLVPREPQPAPVLLHRQDQVTRLITGWNDALADSIAAHNLYLDEPKERRRAAIDRVRTAAGGECRPEGALVAENALRGRWRLRCSGGDLRVSITLAPTEPASVQALEVIPIAREASLSAAPVCR